MLVVVLCAMKGGISIVHADSDPAARGTQRVWKAHEERRDLYRNPTTQDKQTKVAEKTKDVNTFLKTAKVSERRATHDEKIKILTAVIAGEITQSGTSTPLSCYNETITSNSPLYGHYTVLRLTQELARSARTDTVTKSDNANKFKDLERIGGVSKDTFEEMLDYVYNTHVLDFTDKKTFDNDIARITTDFEQAAKNGKSAVCVDDITIKKFARRSRNITVSVSEMTANKRNVERVIKEFAKETLKDISPGITKKIENAGYKDVLSLNFMDSMDRVKILSRLESEYGHSTVSTKVIGAIESAEDFVKKNPSSGFSTASKYYEFMRDFQKHNEEPSSKIIAGKVMPKFRDFPEDATDFLYFYFGRVSVAYQMVQWEKVEAKRKAQQAEQARQWAEQARQQARQQAEQERLRAAYSDKDRELFSATVRVPNELGGGTELERFGGLVDVYREIDNGISRDYRINNRIEQIQENFELRLNQSARDFAPQFRRIEREFGNRSAEIEKKFKLSTVNVNKGSNAYYDLDLIRHNDLESARTKRDEDLAVLNSARHKLDVELGEQLESDPEILRLTKSLLTTYKGRLLEVLGFSAGANPSKAAILKRYKSFSMIYHPDKFAKDKAIFQAIGPAVEYLRIIYS